MNRIRSPRTGWNGSDEFPVRPIEHGLRNLRSRIPEISFQDQSEPSGVDGWIEEISRTWKGGPENTLELARLLHQARRSMEYGLWSRLCRDKRLPFSKRKADILVVIGRGLEGLD